MLPGHVTKNGNLWGEVVHRHFLAFSFHSRVREIQIRAI